MLMVILVIVLIAWIFCRRNKKTTVVRYYRPSCPACVASQEEWDKFKTYSNRDKDLVIIEVNTEVDNDLTRKWKAYYNVSSVPTVIKIPKWTGIRRVYSGERTAEDYSRFAKSPV